MENEQRLRPDGPCIRMLATRRKERTTRRSSTKDSFMDIHKNDAVVDGKGSGAFLDGMANDLVRLSNLHGKTYLQMFVSFVFQLNEGQELPDRNRTLTCYRGEADASCCAPKSSDGR